MSLRVYYPPIRIKLANVVRDCNRRLRKVCRKRLAISRKRVGWDRENVTEDSFSSLLRKLKRERKEKNSKFESIEETGTTALCIFHLFTRAICDSEERGSSDKAAHGSTGLESLSPRSSSS